MIKSLFKDRTVSWGRIVNGINKCVTEMSEEVSTENVDLFISTVKPVAKVKPRSKTVVNLSSDSVLINERTWIDIETQPFDRCFEVSQFMTRTLRHEAPILEKFDEAIKFDDLIEKLKIKFAGTPQWTVSIWVNSLAKGGGKKKRFQYCLNLYASNKILYLRAIEGHSGENYVDPLLQNNFLLRDDFAEYIHHIRNAYEMHSIVQSGLIPGGKSNRRDIQSVFFTAVNLMDFQLHQHRATCGKVWSEKGIVILSNMIASNHSFRNTAGDLFR